MSEELKIGQKVKLTKDIYDDGQDHHPPGYIAYTGETVVIRAVHPDYVSVSHEDITDRSFIAYPGEYETIPANTPESERDFPEASEDGIGRHLCFCGMCGHSFYGFKNRTACKLCTDKIIPARPRNEEVAQKCASDIWQYLDDNHFGAKSNPIDVYSIKAIVSSALLSASRERETGGEAEKTRAFKELYTGDRFMIQGTLWTKIDSETARKHVELYLREKGYGYYGSPICSFEPDDQVVFIPAQLSQLRAANGELKKDLSGCYETIRQGNEAAKQLYEEGKSLRAQVAALEEKRDSDAKAVHQIPKQPPPLTMSTNEQNTKSAPCKVVPTSRQVIEGKLLASLNDESKVAILAERQDIEDLIFALESYSWDPERQARCLELAKGLRQLATEAFLKPVPAERS